MISHLSTCAYLGVLMLIWPVTLCLGELENTNSTELVKSDNNQNATDTFDDSLGRSMLSEIPREGRIINDQKMSIKGFIPIVGISEETKENSKQQENASPYDSDYAKYMQNNALLQALANQQDNLPQHVAKPEDQRYIGAALQGLLGNVDLIRKPASLLKPPIRRKSDCVCVPFYLCKNGYVTQSSSDFMPSTYPQPYQQRKLTSVPEDPYLAINERSNDDDYTTSNQTQLSENILARMISGKSISDGCGLLRTCCQRTHPGQMIPIIQEEFPSGMDYLPPELSGYPGSSYYPRPPVHPSHPLQKPSYGGVARPPMRPPVRSSYRPPKLVNAPSHFEPVIDTSLPVPIRHGQADPGMKIAYDKCGTRQSVGINGRVQNLNYHESSTEFGEFPWQVAILKRLGPSDNLYVCGGALISSSFILTAAHCLKKFQAHDLKVRLGEWDVHREDEFYPYIEKNVVEIVVHPHFSPRNLANDIALLRLDSDIDLNQQPHITPICLADAFESFVGHRCYVSGWGKSSFGQQGEYQSVLMKVDLPVLDNRQCENLLKRTKLGYSFRLDRSMICAGGEPGKDACEGDGGSGLVCEVNGYWKVAGLVSWGLGCGQAGVPGVYTNVGQLRAWVDRVVVPYHSSLFAAKSNQNDNTNFNELINERSLGDNSTLAEAPSTNSTQTSL